MPTKLTARANDGSTFAVTILFRDEVGFAVIPNTIEWSLYNENDTIINSRDRVAIAVPDDTITIILSGNDLKHSEGAQRVLAVYATYDSDLGFDLPLNDEVSFFIQPIKGV